MIIVSGTFFVRPEKREEAVRAMIDMAAETQKEAGCICYDFSADLADTTKFYIYEEWETAEALEAHGETAHMAVFRTKIPDVVSSPPRVNRYAVAS